MTEELEADIAFRRDEALGMAIRVEDAMNVMNALIDGAEVTTSPNDYKRHTAILLARDRCKHLEYVVKRLRGLPIS